jgi:hypothetical protein
MTALAAALCGVRGVGNAPTATRVALVAVAAIGHLVVLSAAQGQGGAGAKALILLPVVLAAWLFGLRVGLAAGLLAVPFNALAVALLSGGSVAIGPGDGPTAVAAITVAAVSGRLRDLGESVRAESRRRDAVQAALRAIERERDRLDGVSLAAREMAHRLNNDLARTVCALDALAESPDLPPKARPLIDQALAGLAAAAADIRRFQSVDRVATWETPLGLALDLERSASR